jgi:hypothetical protein
MVFLDLVDYQRSPQIAKTDEVLFYLPKGDIAIGGCPRGGGKVPLSVEYLENLLCKNA